MPYIDFTHQSIAIILYQNNQQMDKPHDIHTKYLIHSTHNLHNSWYWLRCTHQYPLIDHTKLGWIDFDDITPYGPNFESWQSNFRKFKKQVESAENGTLYVTYKAKENYFNLTMTEPSRNITNDQHHTNFEILAKYYFGEEP